MNFSAPSALAAKAHLAPAGKPAPPRPRTSAASTSLRRPSRPSSVSARRSPLQSLGAGEHRLGQEADPLRLLGGDGSPPRSPARRRPARRRPCRRPGSPGTSGRSRGRRSRPGRRSRRRCARRERSRAPPPPARPWSPSRRRSRRSRCRPARAASPAAPAGRHRRWRPRRRRPPAVPTPRRRASDRRRSPRRDRPSPPSAPRARWARRRSGDGGSARRGSGTRLHIYRLRPSPDQLDAQPPISSAFAFAPSSAFFADSLASWSASFASSLASFSALLLSDGSALASLTCCEGLLLGFFDDLVRLFLRLLEKFRGFLLAPRDFPFGAFAADFRFFLRGRSGDPGFARVFGPAAAAATDHAGGEQPDDHDRARGVPQPQQSPPCPRHRTTRLPVRLKSRFGMRIAVGRQGFPSGWH